MKRELGALLPGDLAARGRWSLFLDDLHWADVSTIDLLNYLAGRFADMRVLVADDLPAVGPGAGASTRSCASSRTSSRAALFDELALGVPRPRPTSSAYLALEFPEHRFPAEFAGADPRARPRAARSSWSTWCATCATAA